MLRRFKRSPTNSTIRPAAPAPDVGGILVDVRQRYGSVEAAEIRYRQAEAAGDASGSYALGCLRRHRGIS